MPRKMSARRSQPRRARHPHTSPTAPGRTDDRAPPATATGRSTASSRTDRHGHVAQARGQKESMTIKLHHLQYLAAVAGRGSVRSAALTLRVSSTAVSRGLIDLENLAGLPLFQRGAAGMLLTDAGKALLTHARQVLGQLDAVDQTLATLRGGTTTRITIGVTPWVARVLLGPTSICSSGAAPMCASISTSSSEPNTARCAMAPSTWRSALRRRRTWRNSRYAPCSTTASRCPVGQDTPCRMRGSWRSWPARTGC